MDQATRTRQWIDTWLEASMKAWSSLPEAERSIDSWDKDQQVDFLVEWPIQEDQLRRLKEYACAGEMTDEQLERLGELEALAAENRPIMRRLRET